MRFLFVDKILALTSGKRALAIKETSAQDYVQPTAGGQPALLSCVIGEALGQLGGWIVLEASRFERMGLAGVVEEVNILADVPLGETVMLEAIIDEMDDETVRYHSEATVNGKTVFTITNSLSPLLPLEQFVDPAQKKKEFEALYQPDTTQSTAPSQNLTPPQVSTIDKHLLFDTIVSEKDDTVIAEKNIDPTAPYFADHFPKKPVLPVSVLLNCKLQLASQFLARLIGETAAQQFYPAVIRRIKVRDYIHPKSQLITTMTLKTASPDRYVFSFKSEVDGKRVCVAEAVLKKRESPC